MRVLINNTVKTDTSDYTFNTREEAEAFYITLKHGQHDRGGRQDSPDPAPARNLKPGRKARSGPRS